MKTRHAVSLVELLVVMSACSIILTMSAGLVHRAMHAQSATHAFFDGERSALRLSEQFRDDVHQAATATVEAPARNDGVFLRLRLAGDQAIEYRQADSIVERILTQRGSRVSRDPIRLSAAVFADNPRNRGAAALLLSSLRIGGGNRPTQNNNRLSHTAHL